MTMRCLTVCAVSAYLLLGPVHAQAQVSQMLLKCTRSLSVAIACVILERGVERVVDVGLDDLVGIAFGREKTLKPEETENPEEAASRIAEIKRDGIEWGKLREFLVSVFKSDRSVNDAQTRDAIAASCRKDYSPICPHLGIMAPREASPDCTAIKTQQECNVSFSCRWKGASCSVVRGLRDLFGQ